MKNYHHLTQQQRYTIQDLFELGKTHKFIASESSFRPKQLADLKNSNIARGLMQKTITIVLVFISLLTFAKSYSGKNTKNDFPLALLTEDFGILNVEDLVISGCWGVPTDYKNSKPMPTSPYPAWQCFETKNVSVICSGNEYDSSEKQRRSHLVVKTKLNGVISEYLGRKLWSLDGCAATRDDMKKIMKNEKFVCVSGSGLDIATSGIHYWIFDRLKTKKGCESYFQGDCKLKNFTDIKLSDCEK